MDGDEKPTKEEDALEQKKEDEITEALVDGDEKPTKNVK